MNSFTPIELGQTLPINNIHAVSVSMPTLKDVIGYEIKDEKVCSKIKSAYPRFVLHPYLKLLAQYIKSKYNISQEYEVVLLSSKKAVDVVSSKYFIHNHIEIDEPFGVILVLKGRQLKNVLSFIQHVGANLSSRFAQDYLYDIGILENKHSEEIIVENAKDVVISTLSDAYEVDESCVKLTPSGMNAMYAALKGIKTIGAKNGRTTLVQFGWLYLDTMNIVKHYFDESKSFYDIEDFELLKNYVEKNGNIISAIVTEYPTNPLLKKTDLVKLKELCSKYNIALIVDSTFASAYNSDIKGIADIYVESLTKFASGNADVLMGAIVLNNKSKYTFIKNEYFKHCDDVYIKDIQRLAYEIKGYKSRIQKSSQNTKELVDFLKHSPFIDKIFYATFNDNTYCPVISITFKENFERIYDAFNFAKGPSLGTEFTLLMPYTYLAHFDYIGNEKGEKFLQNVKLPIELLRISVGVEEIKDIVNEFKRVFNII